jgi:acetolactate synthase small subunit
MLNNTIWCLIWFKIFRAHVRDVVKESFIVEVKGNLKKIVNM